MITGLNQNLDILGRVFHIQTEVSGEEDLFIRTAVFVSGKIVATRESKVDPSQRDNEDTIKDLMEKQHRIIYENVVERAKNFQARKRESAISPEVPLPTGGSGELPGEPPSPELNPVINSSIRVRRIFGEFRQRIEAISEKGDQNATVRLDQAAEYINIIIGSPSFSDFRVDEQVGFNILKYQINEWNQSPRDQDQGDRIWAEVVTFVNYLEEVNNRIELIAFDQALLKWAIHTMKKDGKTFQVQISLASLFGRNINLDRMLNGLEKADDDAWLELLQRLLSKLEKSPQ